MTLHKVQSERLAYLLMANGMLVLLIGLIAGIMLTFSLLDAVTLWPLPAWEVDIPGSTRGWQAAHVGGILNGVMLSGIALIMLKLELVGRDAYWVGWGMIITGWANTVFYWVGNLAANRGLSVESTPFGEGDIAGAIAFLSGGAGMVLAIVAVIILAVAGFRKARFIEKE